MTNDRSDAMGEQTTPPRGESASRRSRLAALLAVVVFATFGIVEFRRCVFGDQIYVPAGFYVAKGPFDKELNDGTVDPRYGFGDVPHTMLPWRAYAARHLAVDGVLPLWTDASLCGAPLAANSQSALFYPPNVVHMALEMAPDGYAVAAMLRHLLAALGAFALARVLGCSQATSLLVGFVYGYAGFMLAWSPHIPGDTAVWLPWLVVAVERLLVTGRVRWIATLACFAALQHLAGHPETAFHSQLATGLYAATRIVQRRRLDGIVKPALRVYGALVAGAMLAAPHLFVLVEYLRLGETMAARVEHAAPSTIAAYPKSAMAFVAALAAAVYSIVRLVRTRTRLGVAGNGLLLGLATAILLLAAIPLRGASDFALMLAPQWYGFPFLHRELGIVMQATTILFVGAALPLAALGVLFARRRTLARALAMVFGFCALAGLRAPFVTDLLDSLPVLAYAANQRVGFLAVLACGLLAALGIEGAATAASQPLARSRFVVLASAPILALLAANFVGHGLNGMSIPKNPRFPIAHGAIEVEFEVAPADAGEDGDGDVALAGTLRSKWPLARAWFEGRVGQEFPIQLELYDAATVAATAGAWYPTHRRARPLPDGRFESRFAVVVPGRFLRDEIGSTPIVAGASQDSRSMRSDYSRESIPAKLARHMMFPRHGNAWVQLAFLFATIVIATLAIGARMPPLGRAALVALVAASIFYATERFIPTVDEARLLPRSPLIDRIAASPPSERALFMNLSMPADVNAWYGIRVANGYDCIYPLHVAQLVREATDRPQRTSSFSMLPLREDIDTRLLGIAAVKHVIGWRQPAANARRVGDPDGYGAPRLALHEIPEFLPRARLVSGVRVAAPGDTLAALKATAFDPARYVLLDAGSPREPAPRPPGEATITISEPERVVVEVAPRNVCHLVLADTHYPGWTATVDGEPREILRANHAFRAVALEPGDRVVEFVYAPASFRAGLVTAALALFSLLALGGWSAFNAIRGFRG
jgi:hypothetical protein